MREMLHFGNNKWRLQDRKKLRIRETKVLQIVKHDRTKD
jgi:hypothetical protein